jgi:hypothetical protein
MANASTLENMSPELLRVVERAQREPEGRFHSLAHLIDVPALERAYHAADRSIRLRLVSSLSTLFGEGPAHGAHEAHLFPVS